MGSVLNEQYKLYDCISIKCFRLMEKNSLMKPFFFITTEFRFLMMKMHPVITATDSHRLKVPEAEIYFCSFCYMVNV